MRAPILGLLLLAACGADTSTSVNVAPSAENKMDDILRAVEHLNEVIGEQTFGVRAVSSGHRIDGEIIVRGTDELAEKNPDEIRIGNTDKTRAGVIVRIVASATPAAIAHELCHAAGLHHVDDPTNLMYRVTAPNRWGLNPAQIEHLRSAALARR